MKKSFSLFESFIVLLLISVIFYTVVHLTGIISYTKHQQYEQTKTLVTLESTRIFLEKKLQSDDNLTLLNHIDNKLYYKGTLLLDNVTSFELNLYNNKISYNICVQSEQLLCEENYLKEQ